MIRMPSAERLSAISSSRPRILEIRTPCSGVISYSVTVGPTVALMVLISIPKLRSVLIIFILIGILLCHIDGRFGIVIMLHQVNGRIMIFSKSRQGVIRLYFPDRDTLHPPLSPPQDRTFSSCRPDAGMAETVSDGGVSIVISTSSSSFSLAVRLYALRHLPGRALSREHPSSSLLFRLLPEPSFLLLFPHQKPFPPLPAISSLYSPESVNSSELHWICRFRLSSLCFRKLRLKSFLNQITVRAPDK